MPVIKKWYLSKTIWVNAIMFAGVILNEALGWNISTEMQGIILSTVNVLLRFITKEEIVW